MTSPTLRRSREAYARASPHNEPTQTYISMGTKHKNLCPRPRAARSVVFSSLTHAGGEVRASAATHKTHANPFTPHPQSRLFTAHRPHQSSREVFRPTFAPQPLCSPLRVRAYPPARRTIPIPKPTQAGARTKRKHKLKVLGTDPYPTPQTEKNNKVHSGSTSRLPYSTSINPSIHVTRGTRARDRMDSGAPCSFLFPPSFSSYSSLLLSFCFCFCFCSSIPEPRASIFN